MGRNYDDELRDIIKNNEQNGTAPRVLLHSCCAPCSSYVIEFLAEYFYVTVLYYNPNIAPFSEYEKRKKEQIKFIKNFKTKYEVSMLDCDYDNDLYEKAVCGLENEPERGSRCTVCFNIRLEKVAKMALDNDYDYFCTTLTLSPYKNCRLINEIGENLSNKYGVSYLVSDFKKRNGYKRSIELSKEYDLYRQDYCGCRYSKRDREKLKMLKKELEVSKV